MMPAFNSASARLASAKAYSSTSGKIGMGGLVQKFRYVAPRRWPRSSLPFHHNAADSRGPASSALVTTSLRIWALTTGGRGAPRLAAPRQTGFKAGVVSMTAGSASGLRSDVSHACLAPRSRATAVRAQNAQKKKIFRNRVKMTRRCRTRWADAPKPVSPQRFAAMKVGKIEATAKPLEPAHKSGAACASEKNVRSG